VSVFFQDFTISASPAVQTVQAGAATIYQVTVSPINGFHQPVLIGCVKSTLPGESTCLANPASLAPNGGAVSALLSISTTAQSTTVSTRSALLPRPSAPPPPPRMLLAVWAGCSLLLLTFLVVRDRMRSRDRARPRTLLFAKLALTMLALTAALWVSCDTNIYTNVIQPNGIIGTPTGNYAITVVGQFIGSTTVNNGQIPGTPTTVTRSTGIDLTVQ
jgi:hypothetical protein